MTRSHSVKVVSLVAFSALLGLVFPMNVTPTFLLSEEDKRLLTQHLQPPAVADIPVDAHAHAPSGPMPAAELPVPERVARANPAPASPVVSEPQPVSSYRMRDQHVSRAIARQERARD